MIRALSAATAALLLLLLSAQTASSAELHWHPCERVLCADMAVPLDRGGTVVGELSLHVQRRPAVRGPRRGVTVLLAGGPGQAAVGAFGGEFPGERPLADYARLTRHNDIVTFDQRGTGRSGRLVCRDLEGASNLDPGRSAEACATLLGERRAYYTTSDSVDDLESLRLALGGPKLTLIGTSYGTYLAQRYAIRYPDAVERMVLDSVVDTTGVDPLYRDRFAAIQRVLGRYCRRGCGFTHDVGADVAKLSSRLAQAPLRSTVGTPSGARRPATLTRSGLLAALGGGGIRESFGSTFPAAVASALRGDAAPILRMQAHAKRATPGGGAFSKAVLAATLCEEVAFPYPRTTPFAARPALALMAAQQVGDAAFAPFDAWTASRTDLLRLCRNWPTAAVQKPVEDRPLPDVPTLILAGGMDVVTPIATARRVAARLPHATLIESPDAGHSVYHQGADHSCADYAVQDFLGGRDARSRCRGEKPGAQKVLRMAPTSLAAVEPYPSVRGARGRVLTGVALTLADASLETLDDLFTIVNLRSDRAFHWSPGLRGGRTGVRFDGRRAEIRFERLEWLPGLRVSGSLATPVKGREFGRLRIEGPAGPNGFLRVRGKSIRGQLGGKRIVIRSFRVAKSLLYAARGGPGASERSDPSLLGSPILVR